MKPSNMSPLAPWARIAIGVDTGQASLPSVRAVRRRGRGRMRWEPFAADARASSPKQDTPWTAWSCALPPGPGITAWLQTPLQDRTKAARVMASVLDMQVPFPLEECLYATTTPVPASDPDLPVTGEGTAALAVAVRKKDLVQHLSSLQDQQGMDPHILDHQGLALWTGIPPGDAGTLRVILWPAGQKMTLVFGMGTAYWNARVVAASAESMLRQIRIVRKTLAGGHCKQAPIQWCLPDLLDSALKDQLLAAEPGSHLTLPDGKHYLARTLAERALSPGAYRFNLRRGALAHPGIARQQQRHRTRQAASLAACALVLVISTAVSHFSRARIQRHLEQEIQSLADNVAGFPVQASGRDALLIAGREQDARTEALRPLRQARHIPALAANLTEAVKHAGGSIQKLQIDLQSLQLVGTLPADSTLPAFDTILADAGFTPQPPRIKEQPEGLRFQLEATTPQPEELP